LTVYTPSTRQHPSYDDCLEVTYNVSNGTLNPTHSHIDSIALCFLSDGLFVHRRTDKRAY